MAMNYLESVKFIPLNIISNLSLGLESLLKGDIQNTGQELEQVRVIHRQAIQYAYLN